MMGNVKGKWWEKRNPEPQIFITIPQTNIKKKELFKDSEHLFILL